MSIQYKTIQDNTGKQQQLDTTDSATIKDNKQEQTRTNDNKQEQTRTNKNKQDKTTTSNHEWYVLNNNVFTCFRINNGG